MLEIFRRGINSIILSLSRLTVSTLDSRFYIPDTEIAGATSEVVGGILSSFGGTPRRVTARIGINGLDGITPINIRNNFVTLTSISVPAAFAGDIDSGELTGINPIVVAQRLSINIDMSSSTVGTFRPDGIQVRCG